MIDQMDNSELAGLYVLGLLDAAEHAAVERRLMTDGALRSAVDYWDERLLPLTSAVEAEALPASLWPRIERSLKPAAGIRPAAAASPWAGIWNSLAFWRSLAVSGFAAAMLLAVVGLPGAPRDETPRYLVVLVAPEDKSPGWVVQASSDRTLKLIPLAGGELPPAKAFQFWTKADKWKVPVSLGLVQPGRSVDVALEKLPPLEHNQLFEITLEPERGSPIGRPTGPILFIGRAVKVM